MSRYATVVTRKGQITVPVDVRRALGLREGDVVSVSVEGSTARLTPAGNFAERTAGMFRPVGPPLSAEELRVAAEEAAAEIAAERVAEP